KAIRRQAAGGARQRRAPGGPSRVTRLVAMRQSHQAFAVSRLMVLRREETVDDDVVDECRAHRAGKTEKTDLDRGRAERQDPRSRVLAGVAGQIDEDVDAVGLNTLGRRGIVDRTNLSKAATSRWRTSLPSSGDRKST